MKILIKLVLGIVLGVAIGFYAPEFIIRTMLTIKTIGAEVIGFSVSLIILFYISSGIASLPNNAGSILKTTLFFAYGFTVLAGILAYLAGNGFIPLLTDSGLSVTHSTSSYEPFVIFSIPPLLSVTSALISAILLGLGVSISNSHHIKSMINEGRNILDLYLHKLIIPLLPFYIAAMFTDLTAQGKVLATLEIFGLVLGLVFTMHWVWLVFLYSLAGAATGQNPFKLLKNMLPAYFTALGTMSSTATIPVTLDSTKKLKINPNVADFTIPICATIHISGSTITIVICALAVMHSNLSLSIPDLMGILPFILMLGITMIAAPGIPGGAVMAASGLLASMLGFGENELALMIALYLAQDSFGTATNVTGDGALSMLVNKYSPLPSKLSASNSSKQPPTISIRADGLDS
jgi:Na+/H+-dicarboxylate symporter